MPHDLLYAVWHIERLRAEGADEGAQSDCPAEACDDATPRGNDGDAVVHEIRLAKKEAEEGEQRQRRKGCEALARGE